MILRRLACLSLLIFFVTSFMSCSESEEADSGAMVHPQETNIPYFDNRHVQVEKENHPQQIPGNDKIGLVKDFLEESENLLQHELNLMLSGVDEIHISSIGEHRLVVLDARENRFFEYDTRGDSTTRLAKTGRGPEDVDFAREMDKAGDSVYVAMLDGKIAKYRCDFEPCEFDDVVQLDISPYSFTANENSFSVIGYPSGLGGERERD